MVGGALVIVSALPIGILLSRWPAAATGAQALHDEVVGRDGPWRLMRATLTYATKPTLIVAGAFAAWVTYRRSPRAAVVFVGYVLLVNVTIQVVKHPMLWQPVSVFGLNPLSGHVGVAAGVTFGWLLVAPERLRATSAAVAVLVVTVVSVGVVLVGWHRVPQVLTPLFICTGWAMVAAAADARSLPASARRRLTLGLVALVAAVSLCLVLVPPTSSLTSLVAVTAGLVLCVVLASVALVCTVASSPVEGDAVADPEPEKGVSPAA